MTYRPMYFATNAAASESIAEDMDDYYPKGCQTKCWLWRNEGYEPPNGSRSRAVVSLIGRSVDAVNSTLSGDLWTTDSRMCRLEMSEQPLERL